ncbi:MAG: hypothetical protein FWD85_13350 [Microbacteriaceae bacterium]|nr:hypothetical protein [Microbacteriaceae bacterium]MCL2796275.1 hypothetical protein [Microbacteriaceae bacterium]
MTDTDVDQQGDCPICGGALVSRAAAAYCPSCDLTFEARNSMDTPPPGDQGDLPAL